MTARDASIDAYHEHVDEHGQLGQMERWYREHGPATRAMAGQALEFPANVYSARANRLVKDGRLVELEQKAPCKVTGITVGWLAHVETISRDHLGFKDCPLCAKDSGIYEMRTLCCAARFIANTGGDRNEAVKNMAEKHGHDQRQLRVAVIVTTHWLREKQIKALAARLPSNDEEA